MGIRERGEITQSYVPDVIMWGQAEGEALLQAYSVPCN